MIVSAVAHPVQGLVCVHGYSNFSLRQLPVDGVFVAIEALQVAVKLECVPNSTNDLSIRSNQELTPHETSRLKTFLSTVSQRVRLMYRIQSVTIDHDLHEGRGLGSSAAVFAALTRALLAISTPLGQGINGSALAKLGSFSAAASFVGGISVVPAKITESTPGAVPLDSRRLRLGLMVIPIGPSRAAQPKLSEEIHADVVTSPYYEMWKELASTTAIDVQHAILDGDFKGLAAAAEPYVYMNFGVMTTGSKNLLPWTPATLQALKYLRAVRQETNLDFFLSANSGPSVFVYASPETLQTLSEYLANDGSDFMQDPPIISAIGGGARHMQRESELE